MNPRTKRPLIIVGAIAILLVALMVFFPGGGQVSGPEGIAGGGVTVVNNVFQSIGGFFSRVFTSIFSPDSLTEKNQALQEELAIAQSQINNLKELEDENQRLREMLNYIEEKPEYDYIACSVIAKDPGYWFDSFTINVGYLDGVEEGDIAITPDGVVGKVSEVGGNWSKVLAIIDSRVSVSAIVQRTRDNGIVTGGLQLSDESGLCSMSFLNSDADLQPGDIVLTSGLGGVFPKGLQIGEIKEVKQGSIDTVIIQPSVDFVHLEELMIIKEKTSVESGGEE